MERETLRREKGYSCDKWDGSSGLFYLNSKVNGPNFVFQSSYEYVCVCRVLC